MRGEDPSGWTEEDIINEASLRYTSRREVMNANATAAYDKKMEAYNSIKLSERASFSRCASILENDAMCAS